MADHKFLFTLNLSDPGGREMMLNDVAANLLGHVGFDESAKSSIIGHLRGAVAAAIGAGCSDCTVQFHADSGTGELLIVVSHDGREWRTTRTLP